MFVHIMVGDALSELAALPDASVHCVVTSPPYWGLRAYKGDSCMIGLEPTFDKHLANLVAVFREVRRVLRNDGTLWLNYGDAYTSGGRTSYVPDASINTVGRTTGQRSTMPPGLKPKDLMMLPARVAMALQADGWWLRSEIIWHKPNPMPESCQDRPTSAHEKMFLLSKSGSTLFWTHPRMGAVRKKPAPDHYWRHEDTKKELDTCPPGWVKNTKSFPWKRLNRWHGNDYFYDADAVRVPLVGPLHAPGNKKLDDSRNDHDRMEKTWGSASGANIRNVWTIPTHAYSDAHFATFPPALVEPCIKAGTSAKGVCAECGAPWVRETDKSKNGDEYVNATKPQANSDRNDGDRGHNWRVSSLTTGWSPSCDCNAATVPATCLDPFAGSGTVGLVADRLQRDAILVEISAEYADMARARIHGDAPLLAGCKPQWNS